MFKNVLEKLKEAAVSVLPITVLVTVLAIFLTDISTDLIIMFLFGALFLVLGTALFTLGVDIALMPIGSAIGSMLSKTKKSRFYLVLFVVFVMGFVVTIAEPDLLVLGKQVGAGKINFALLICIAAGVGAFLVVSIVRTFFNLKLSYLLLAGYLPVFGLAIALHFVNPDFLSLAFDSGGVTTGSITVPFLMALGLGLTSVRGSKDSQDDSFGMVALCSIGPIIAVLIMGLVGADISAPVIPSLNYDGAGEIAKAFGSGFLDDMLNVCMALGPIILLFVLFQIFALRLPKSSIIRICVGLFYTFMGLTVFLAGVNVGFEPMGYKLGEALGAADFKFALIPLGLVLGCLIVLAEPAVHVLTKQVEEVTGGAIPKKMILIFLCVAVALSIALSMVRVLTGVSIWWFIVPCYAIALVMMFFVPSIFTGIAFDSGGIASGPITAAFLLPLAIGATQAVGGNSLTDAYGLVAFVSMIPLIVLQAMGLVFKLKTRRAAALGALVFDDDQPVDFDDSLESECVFVTDENCTQGLGKEILYEG